MTQPTERRFVMEPRLDAEVQAINDELALKANTADLGEAAYLDQTEFTHIGNLDYAQFDTTYAGGSTAPGQLAWDQANETLQFMLDDHVTLQVGQEHVMRVKNNSGSVAIPERTVVMFAGATGHTIKVAPAVSNGSVNVNYLAGITTEEIPADGFGFVTQLGFINHVNTNGWPVGTILYVDPAVPGGLTATEPDLPSWTMPVAAVTKQNTSAGRMLVRAIPGGSGAGGSSVVISDTVPAGGSKGDLWLDSTDGTLYIYFEDVDGSQWIQVQANSALEGSILSRLGALESQAIAYGRPSYNYIINGGFDIWQRGASFSNPTSGAYLADRWVTFWNGSGATRTVSKQAFTPGSAPVAGYEAESFFRFAQTVAGTSGTFNTLQHRIEDVRTFAGQVMTISFWAKADAARTISVTPFQNFGTGGSTQVLLTSQNITLSTSWVRYTASFTVPGLSGKTIGTSSYFGLEFGLPLNAVGTFDFWGMQAEEGSVATAFRRNSPSIQAELAACQRYYWRSTPSTYAYQQHALGAVTTATSCDIFFHLPVNMRVRPTSLEYANIQVIDSAFGGTSTGFALGESTGQNMMVINVTGSGYNLGRPAWMRNGNNVNGYIAFNAEL